MHSNAPYTFVKGQKKKMRLAWWMLHENVLDSPRLVPQSGVWKSNFVTIIGRFFLVAFAFEVTSIMPQ